MMGGQREGVRKSLSICAQGKGRPATLHATKDKESCDVQDTEENVESRRVNQRLTRFKQ